MKKYTLLTSLLLTGSFSHAQQPPTTILRTESRVVLVDSIVTDKKGNYLRDLTQKDFHVFEDNKEQTVSSFSFEGAADPSAKPQMHYTVLFFDNSNVDASEQPRVRREALKFVEANMSPNRMIAVVNFSGSLRVAQNFTKDVDRLRNVINGVKGASVPSTDVDAAAAPRLASAAADFGARSMILALRSLAHGLAPVQGRKTVVLLSPGFKFKPDEHNAELNVTLAECSRANVAIYAVDVRGLVAGDPSKAFLEPGSAFLRNASYSHTPLTFAQSVYYFFQARPAGGAIGTSGDWSNPANQAHLAIPPMPDSVISNQEVLMALSSGSGGFLIKNTNDLAGGLTKISKEQDEYYLLGYTPPEAPDGSCHKLRVTVDRGGAVERSRAGYCSSRPVNVLVGNSVEKDLENAVAATGAVNSSTSLTAPFFYTAPNLARVNVAMEIPLNKLKAEPQKGKLHSEINLLGIAYRKDGSVAARFTDAVKLDFEDQARMDAFTSKRLHYENQFDIGPGDYTLKVGYGLGGGQFEKTEAPLALEPYDTAQFALSGVALSRQYAPLTDARVNLDSVWMEGRTPLIASNTRFVPAGSSRFKNTDPAAIYAEVYEPILLAAPDPKTPLAVAVAIRILDRKTGAEKLDTGLIRVGLPEKTGNPVVPIAVKMPIEGLAPGAYILELEAGDVTGRAVKRLTNFDIE